MVRSSATPPDDLDRLQALFEEVLEKPPGAREELLEALAAREPETAERLRALLSADGTGDSMEPGFFGLDDATFVEEGPGDVIGPYTLEEAIGSAGFGRVYRASQTEPVRRKVAIKLLKAGMDSREVVRRFEAEREVLALMDHPAIARVLDAGVTPAGRPFFAMELVEGESLVHFADAHELDLRERLHLFVEICRAVQHAHQKGVIHRDLKPSNVLVRMVDGVPRPKVIDFGIAKAVHGHLGDTTFLTAQAAVVGTPTAMAPEQARGDRDVDTRADVYALGAMLQELLTGSPLFDRERLSRAGLGEVLRILLEEEPMRLSERARRMEAAARAARCFGSRDPARLLGGDLEWIVARAVEKERSRRYSGVGDLAADLLRYLDGEAVSVGPPTVGYRLGKFLRKHRAVVTSAALIVIALVLGIVGTTLGMLEAARQRDAAEEEGRAARQAFRWFATAISGADADVVLDPDVSARALLHRAGARVTEGFEGRPAGEAIVRGALGRAYVSLRDYAAADHHLRRAIELVEQGCRHDPIEHYRNLWALTGVAFKIESGDSYLVAQAAMAAGRALIGKEDSDLADALEAMYDAAIGGEIDRCEFAFMDALPRARALPEEGPLVLVVADTWMACAYALWYSGDEIRTAPFLEETLAIRERALGPSHPDTAEARTHLVGVLQRAGRFLEAERRIRDALDELREVLPRDHEHVAMAEAALGECLVARGAVEEARPFLERSHAIVLRTWGPDRFFGMESSARMVRFHEAAGEAERAAVHRAALLRPFARLPFLGDWGVASAALGPSDAELARLFDLLHRRAGRRIWSVRSDRPASPETREALERLLEIFSSRPAAEGDRGLFFGRLLVGLQNGFSELPAHLAARLDAEAVRQVGSRAGEIPLPMAELELRLARRATAEDARARHLARGLELLDRVRAPGTWLVAAARARIARHLGALGRKARARELLDDALTDLSAQLGPDAPETRAARAVRARIDS